MALIKCTECGKEISDRAAMCINCGCPISCILADHKKIQMTPLKEKEYFIKEQGYAELIKKWEPSAQECKRISTGWLAQQWEENDKEKLHSLFSRYPYSIKVEEVKQKVRVLDKVYSTQIHRFNPEKGIQIVVYHICSISEIDERLSGGDISVVDEIANTKDKLGKNVFSFATKYSYFSNPKVFPICDKNVCTILRNLNMHECFYADKIPAEASELPKVGGVQGWKQIIDAFKSHFNIQQFSYREIDLYLSIKFRELNGIIKKY